MIRRTHPANRRRGFTLIELLTVMAIIIALLAISIGAYFRVRQNMVEGATGTTLSKCQSQMDVQIKAVMDQVRDDSKNGKIPPGVYTLANQDNRRQLAIWTKMKMKIEFPQNFWEVLVWPSTVGLTPKQGYIRALDPILPSVVQNPNLGTMTIDDQMNESAALFYLALTQGRRGENAFNPTEHFGANAVGKVTLYGKEFNVVIDSWGSPIGFIRWPFGAVGMDLNQPPFRQVDNRGQVIDPQDPERTLYDPGWLIVLRNNFIGSVGHPISVGNPLNLSPVICSAGRDKKWGLDATYPGNAYARVSAEEDDNVYGYRHKRPQ